VSEWKTIESAPKDGTVILVWTTKATLRCIEWREDMDEWMLSGTDNCYIRERFLDRWTLPDPPK
jgi:hypothetical protein